ncbi:MAG: YcaO-like family protein [Candidatus Nitrosopolaris sp.]
MTEQVIGAIMEDGVTYLVNKLYIPNYSVILPGTDDTIWVYGGKGITRSHAKASDLMEAIERYSSLSSSYARSFIQGRYSQLSKSYNKVLHHAEVVEPLYEEYNDDPARI